jgi:hypothetical protein
MLWNGKEQDYFLLALIELDGCPEIWFMRLNEIEQILRSASLSLV